jgi:hypothetical protein
MTARLGDSRPRILGAAALVAATLSACGAATWTALAERTAIGQQTQPYDDCRIEALRDWGFRRTCGDEVVFIRCGWGKLVRCCWPVATEIEATEVVGGAGVVVPGRMCDER